MAQPSLAQEQSNLSPLRTPTTHRPIDLSDMQFWDKWKHCAPFINAALAYSGHSHTLDDVAEVVRKGDAQFWCAQDAGLVTEIIEYPRRRTLRFWLAGGDLNTLKDIEKDAIQWSKTWGCVASEIVGRRGWVKALEGYEDVATVGVKNYG